MEEVHHSEFDGPNFNAKDVVQRYRKRIPLPQLQKSLRAHHAATRQELVELINEKYADFVSLSSRMQGVERALKPLKAPLEESCELTKSLKGKLGGLLDKAEEAHEALARIRARKDALNTYIENAKLFDKVKGAAGQRWSNPQESDDFLREHTAQENVARDLRRIRLNLGGSISLKPPPPPPPGSGSAGPSGNAQVESSPECAALLAEAISFQETFASRLQERLRGLVAAARRSWEESAEPGPPPRSELLAISHTSRALCTIGHAATVEAIFTEVFVKPALTEASAACNTAAEEAKRKAMAETGSAGGGSKLVGVGAVDLGVFFQSVQKTLFSEAAPLLWLARRLRGNGSSSGSGDVEDSALLAVPSLRLVSRAVVLPALHFVQEVWPNVFMPAFPDTFAANYVHFTKFLQAAEGAMASGEAESLHKDPALGDFQRKWKTQVYVPLRAKEATQRLDAAKKQDASAQPGQKHAAGGHDYFYEVSAEVMRILDAVWNRWYLNSLYPKMARLSLELLARYGRIMQDFAEAGSSTSGTGWDAAASRPNWSASSIPVRMSRAASDMLQLISELEAPGDNGYVASLFLTRLSGGDGSVAEEKPRELTRALLKEAAEGLRPSLQALKDLMLKQVVAAMVPQFAAIRGIPQFYRMLNKPVPTKASPYVESAMRPLQAFQEVAAAAVTAPGAVDEWLREVVDSAAAEFTSQATQLLESTHQQEASLRRLAGRGSGNEAQVSDLDKIHMQLCLDVDTFSKAASALGPASAAAPGLAKLAEVVASVRREVPAFE